MLMPLPGKFLTVWCLLGMICTPAYAGEESIITTDGRLIQGTIKTVGSALKVETVSPRRDIFLSPILVAERKPVTTVKDPEPSFSFHTELAGHAKKGTIAPVVENFQWGAMQPDGTTSVSMKDPVLGAVEFRVVIAHVTPQQVEMRGVEYSWVRTFSIAGTEQLVVSMVNNQIRQNPTTENWLKLATFNRMRGRRDQMEKALDEALKAGASQDACAAERSKLEQDSFEKKLTELEKSLESAGSELALQEAALLEIPDALKLSNPLLHGLLSSRLAALKKRAERHREVKEALTKRNLPLPSLSPAQMDRLERVLKQGPDHVDEKWIPDLCKAWAEGMTVSKWDAATLEEAQRLAALIERFFAEGDAKKTAPLADALKSSPLPLALKLALLRHAARFPEAPADAVAGWKQVEFKLPDVVQPFHYFVSVPSTYRADTPTTVLIAMHGQTSTAEVMRRVWGERTEREGWILISPEYIYGRKWGYLFSTEEHQAVVEAFRHAARYLNMDPNRVFLTGQSQGGHASWDIGAAHAGVFAAVVPVIGAPMKPDHWPNFKDTSVYSIDGSLDGNAPKLNRLGVEALCRMRTNVTYVEYPGRGHEGFSEEYDTAIAWLHTRQRSRCDQVNLVAFRNIERRRRWVEILTTSVPLADRIAGPQKSASVEGQIKPNNQIELKTSQVSRMRVLMPAEQVDLDKPVTVKINGRQASRGLIQLDWNVALRECLARADRSDLFLAEVLLNVK